MEYLPIAVSLIIPLLLVVLLKSNGAIIFFCVAAGVLLQQFLDPDAAKLANSLLPSTGVDYISLAVLLVPVIIAAVLYGGTSNSRNIAVHVFLALLAGLSAVLILDRFLPSSWTIGMSKTTAFKLIKDYQTVIIASGILLSVFILKPHKPHDKHKKHH